MAHISCLCIHSFGKGLSHTAVPYLRTLPRRGLYYMRERGCIGDIRLHAYCNLSLSLGHCSRHKRLAGFRLRQSKGGDLDRVAEISIIRIC